MQIHFFRFSLAIALTSLLLAGPVFAQQPGADPAPSTTVTPVSPDQFAEPAIPVEQPSASQSPETSASPLASPETPVANRPEEEQPGFLVCYREKRFVGAALNTSVHVDDLEIADMDNGCYIIVKVKPGEHKLYADEMEDAITVKVEAGKAYYFRMELAMGLWKGHGRLKEVDIATGEQEFKKWNPEFSSDIRQPDMVVKEL